MTRHTSEHIAKMEGTEIPREKVKRIVQQIIEKIEGGGIVYWIEEETEVEKMLQSRPELKTVEDNDVTSQSATPGESISARQGNTVEEKVRQMELTKPLESAHTHNACAETKAEDLETIRRKRGRHTDVARHTNVAATFTYPPTQLHEPANTLKSLLQSRNREGPQTDVILRGLATPESVYLAIQAGFKVVDTTIVDFLSKQGILICFGELPYDHQCFNMHSTKYADVFRTVDNDCGCKGCREGHTLAYIHHLHTIGDIGAVVACLTHNLYTFENWIRRLETTASHI